VTLVLQTTDLLALVVGQNLRHHALDADALGDGLGGALVVPGNHRGRETGLFGPADGCGRVVLEGVPDPNQAEQPFFHCNPGHG